MKKILLTLALAFCCAAGQGQTTAKPADVNIQELNTKWAKFTQYAEQKQINKAVEEGMINISYSSSAVFDGKNSTSFSAPVRRSP